LAETLRFVKGPDGNIWFDQSFKAPGEGVFVTLHQEQALVDVFSEIESQLKAPLVADMEGHILQTLKKLALQSLALSKKQGGLVLGADKCREVAKSGTLRYVVLADNAGADAKNRAETFEKHGVKVYKGFTKEDLTAQFGGVPVSILGSTLGKGLEIPLMRYQLFSAMIK
jgi:predicted RNA-binding protein YlxR (DUF448 family)